MTGTGAYIKTIMLSKIKETSRRVVRSNSVSDDSSTGNTEPRRYIYNPRISLDKRRNSVAVTETSSISKKMERPRPPLRKRGSSLFNKMTSPETYDSLVPRSASSSRLSDRPTTESRDSPFPSLTTRIKAHRMRKNSQLSLSLGPLEEHEIRQPLRRDSPPRLLRTHSVPDLLSKSQAAAIEPRTFCNGKPISHPFNFRHLSHLATQQGAQFDDTPEDVLPLQWNYMLKEAKAPKTPIVPLTPLTPRSVRHMQSLSGSLLTTGLPMPSPSVDSVYSPVDSIADLSLKSKSAESLNNAFASHLTPPPRSSSRTAFTSSLDTKEDDVPILESEGRDSVIFLQEDIAPLPRDVSPILEENTGFLDQIVEDDVLRAFPSPPVASPPSFSPSVLSQAAASQRPPNPSSIVSANNQLMPPLSPLRPSSSSSGTLGLGVPAEINHTLESIPEKRISKIMSKRISRRVSILVGHTEGDSQNWEADIDWTYDNNDLDEWVDDLHGIEEEETETGIELGSKSAPVSASPSAVNLVSLDLIAAKRHLDDSKNHLAAPEDDIAPKSPGIGIADGGFGTLDHAGRQYNAFGHQRQLSKTRNSVGQRTLSTCASLPNLRAGRSHYRNASLRGISNLDNGIVTLDEADELHHRPSMQIVPSAPREVAIPPARYSGRSRAASNATCTTLVSDVEGYPSDLSEMASTPSHSNHNSAEGPFFLPQNHDSIFLDDKSHTGSRLHIVNDDVPFTFF